jgi:hypothetical protein
MYEDGTLVPLGAPPTTVAMGCGGVLLGLAPRLMSYQRLLADMDKWATGLAADSEADGERWPDTLHTDECRLCRNLAGLHLVLARALGARLPYKVSDLGRILLGAGTLRSLPRAEVQLHFGRAGAYDFDSRYDASMVRGDRFECVIEVTLLHHCFDLAKLEQGTQEWEREWVDGRILPALGLGPDADHACGTAYSLDRLAPVSYKEWTVTQGESSFGKDMDGDGFAVARVREARVPLRKLPLAPSGSLVDDCDVSSSGEVTAYSRPLDLLVCRAGRVESLVRLAWAKCSVVAMVPSEVRQALPAQLVERLEARQSRISDRVWPYQYRDRCVPSCPVPRYY